jgi:hypothetical protein
MDVLMSQQLLTLVDIKIRAQVDTGTCAGGFVHTGFQPETRLHGHGYFSQGASPIGQIKGGDGFTFYSEFDG